MKFLLKQGKQELKRENKYDQEAMNLGSLMSLKSSLFMISGSKKSFSVSESQLEAGSETEPDSSIKEGSSLFFSEPSSPASIRVEKVHLRLPKYICSDLVEMINRYGKT